MQNTLSVPFQSFLVQLKRTWDRSCKDEEGSSISVAELCVGLQYLMEKADEEREHRRIPRANILRDPFVLINLRHFCMFAHGAYSDTVTDICSKTPLVESDIVQFQPVSKQEQPAYFLAVDHFTKNIVLSICGTKSFQDVLTDVTVETTEFLDGYGPKGMVAAVYWLQSQVMFTIIDETSKYPSYGLVFVGHSLGGAVATLMSLLVRKTYGIPVICYSYAPPPCVCSSFVPLTKEFGVITVILDTDLIPRFNPKSLDLLVVELRTLDWQQVYFRKSELHSKLFGVAVNYLGEETTNQLSQQISNYLRKGLRKGSQQVLELGKNTLLSKLGDDEKIKNISKWQKRVTDISRSYWYHCELSTKEMQPLQLAGNIWHIQREGNQYFGVQSDQGEYWNKIEPSRQMLQDHRISQIEWALQHMQLED
ncbi:hypothetical protein GpartN1_g5907.t1 [Galdieria partita]|uniref:sn-1-specific diacylglycerol lipase n=1 Tax=Galdieria partita TaxID=83374 RepID=A0A9C7Q265_9RHOD|nr:hypothetical protein GpartN1_g5907.t1 [Galdieria partita]